MYSAVLPTSLIAKNELVLLWSYFATLVKRPSPRNQEQIYLQNQHLFLYFIPQSVLFRVPWEWVSTISHVGKFVEKLSQDLFEESREDLLLDWAGIFVWTNSEWFRHHLSFSEKMSDAKEEMKKGRFVTFQPQIHILKSWNSGILI